MRLESPAFTPGGPIPRLHTGEGRDHSPPLRWSGAPAATRSFALILEDPDAPPGTWVHWVLFDLPATLRELPQGLDRAPIQPDGSRHGSCWGVNRFPRVGYYGPQPPPGPAHRYVFRLTALDTVMHLPPGTTAPELRRAMEGHILEEATLTGLYASRS